ncbi:WXG100 family type VII secretion target [Actinospica robiniae]|uniref:WXG100 family type VII secretion target n=1 Tax=Actinospica robiniae TaxID=304901 RepID=UPI0003F5470F|nr:hypothetical protein [Actinospica robiniae]
MSGAGFKIEVDDLLAIAPQIGESGQVLVDSMNSAVATLQSLGSFWGDDKPGTQFAASYQKISAEVLLMLTKIAEDLEGVSQGLTKMAASYGQTEADITEGFRHGGTYAL